MKNKYLSIISFLLICFLLNINTTLAQSASGKIIYTVMEDGKGKVETKSINGTTFQNGMLNARLETNDKSSIFNNVTGVCENWVVPVGTDNAFTHGVCLMSDKDGDTFVTYITSMALDKSVITHAKGGTVKFANLNGKGTATRTMPADTGIEADCCMAKWTLKYKL